MASMIAKRTKRRKRRRRDIFVDSLPSEQSLDELLNTGIKGALMRNLADIHSINSDLFSDKMTLAVMGLLFKTVAENSTDPTIFDQMDFTAGTFAVNLNTTVGQYVQNENVFHYKGSLTTPECSEIVNWFVVQKIYPIRPSQLAAIQAQLNDAESNSRPVQDLNQR